MTENPGMKFTRGCAAAVIHVCLSTLSASGDSQPQPAAHGGQVAGRVIYEPDAARPWRFQRYYVKDARSGAMGEAVVALRGSGLNRVSSPASRSSAHTIDQVNYQFVPEVMAIREGEAITFTNSDMTTHNVRSTAEIALFNVNLDTEDEFTHEFKKAGGMRAPVQLGCVYHGGMRAWVYVFDHPFFAVTGEDGTFRFEDVPPGRYTLEMVHPAGGLRWKDTIVVDEANTVLLEIRVSPDQKTTR